MKTLRLILGDQLNRKHSWFQHADEDVHYCIFEMKQETNYVKHHILKIGSFFKAMRSFGEFLENNGHALHYLKINDPENAQTLPENLGRLISKYGIERFEYLLPDEYRLDQQLKAFCAQLEIESQVEDTEHFFTTRAFFQDHFKEKKQFLMENFYREMRKRHNVLMDGDHPHGGEWNYDKSNRKKWKGKPAIPPIFDADNDIRSILEEVEKAGIATIGEVRDHTPFPIDLDQANKQLEYFCSELLIHFGDYQDAMHLDEDNLFHSRLSFAMNAKIISPREIIDRVVEEFRKRPDEIHISQVEGFVRQIIGWREYVRGLYWMKMPDYAELNALGNDRPLPDFYWTGKTKMNCLSQAIGNSLKNAYAHHIQRLMITGNFALLIGADPSEVDAWYLGVYADAIEWVEMPNTRGMSQYADGGLIATKPYVSAASYINK
ncbi:MAG: cryptochrome/photolyase family protein, partial [Flavobacteriales bacterium]|nr:cryptochrome/photolyase family protein [Flavobacteriales bacterium]